MKALYLILLLASAQPASAQQAAGNKEIVVTGVRLSDTRKALEECLKRKCPPEEDINATLAHAENLFVAGDYQQARRTVKQSISRNDRHARAHPVPVSDLYRVSSRISAHLGEGDDFKQSTYAVRRILKTGLPDEDVRIIGADFEVAGMQASMNRLDPARTTYKMIEKKALAIGRTDLAMQARIREAWLSYLENDLATARKKLTRIRENQGPDARIGRLSALVLLARLDRNEGKAGSSDELIRELKQAGFTKPTLIYSPPIDLGVSRTGEGEMGSTTRLLATDTFDDKWVDIAFWVKPDGRVEDVEILRQQGPSDWVKPVLASIQGRIYSPLSDTAGNGVFRVERYSYTSFWTTVTGTRLRQRSAAPRIEFLDLTDEPEPKK